MEIKRIALAVAPSPRLEGNLAESCRLRNLLGAQLVLVHVGDEQKEMEQLLHDLLPHFGLQPQDCTLVWKTGDTVNGILEACREYNVDLLIAGALEKEGFLKYYIGSVARQLGRKANCSVLMLTDPSVETHAFRKIVVSGTEASKPDTIEMAVLLAKLEHASTLDIVQESDYHNIAQLGCEDKSSGEAENIKEDLIKKDKEKLDKILACTDCGNLQINSHHLEGKPGFTISNYAREQHADLLVLSSPDKKLNLLDRMFPHDIEYVLADLPCSLLIVNTEQMN